MLPIRRADAAPLLCHVARVGLLMVLGDISLAPAMSPGLFFDLPAAMLAPLAGPHCRA
jgi:hypothetical protein